MLLLCVDISKLIKYYTDAHDVDETTRTVCSCGGMWYNANMVGTACRYMYDDPLFSITHVASSNIQIQNYTDQHNVDEDIMTLLLQGGSWARKSRAGIAHRDLNINSTHIDVDIASVKNRRLAVRSGLLVFYTYFRLMNVSWIQQISCNQTTHQ